MVPYTRPATNAAMKPLPSSGAAEPVRERRRHQREQEAPVRLLLVTGRRGAPVHQRRADAGDHAHQHAVADRLRDHPRGLGAGERAGALVGERQRDDQRRDAEAVVEAARR
jgi:hypothetical protein